MQVKREHVEGKYMQSIIEVQCLYNYLKQNETTFLLPYSLIIYQM